MFKLWKLWVIVKVHILNETQSIVFKNVSTLKTSFGAKPNVLQFWPLSNFYVVNVIQPLCTLLMFNRFIHITKVLARLESYLIQICFIWFTTFYLSPVQSSKFSHSIPLQKITNLNKIVWDEYLFFYFRINVEIIIGHET